MVQNLHQIPVEELHHQDWHSVLKVLDLLVADLDPMARRGGSTAGVRAALIKAAQQATHERLPMDPPIGGESESGNVPAS